MPRGTGRLTIDLETAGWPPTASQAAPRHPPQSSGPNLRRPEIPQPSVMALDLTKPRCTSSGCHTDDVDTSACGATGGQSARPGPSARWLRLPGDPPQMRILLAQTARPNRMRPGPSSASSPLNQTMDDWAPRTVRPGTVVPVPLTRRSVTTGRRTRSRSAGAAPYGLHPVTTVPTVGRAFCRPILAAGRCGSGRRHGRRRHRRRPRQGRARLPGDGDAHL